MTLDFLSGRHDIVVVVEKEEFDSCSCEAWLIWSDGTCLFSGNVTKATPLPLHERHGRLQQAQGLPFATYLHFIVLTRFTGAAPISALIFPNNINRITPIRGCTVSVANLWACFLLYNVCQMVFLLF